MKKEMRVLMIAPEPFFQERGTPFSEFYRIKAMTELGYEIDLVTYPIGYDIKIDKLRIYRVTRLPGLKNIPVGPSLIKLPLDILVFIKSLVMLLKYKYDLVHTHEEAGFMGAIFKRLFKIKHLYDMHSSLSEQFINFNITKNHFIIKIIELFEKIIIKNSDCVIVICDHLKEVARKVDKDAKVIIIENTVNPKFYHYFPLREDNFNLSVKEGEKLILYLGTFEYYQGIDIIVGAARYLKDRNKGKGLIFVCVGGNEQQQEGLKKMVEREGVKELFFIGGRLSFFNAERLIEQADILLSPRREGVNTPLKIYSYLHAGKPIIATNLLTHTQTLNNQVAKLCDSNGESFGKAIEELLEDKEYADRLGTAAKKYFEDRYGYDNYKELVKKALEIALGKK